MAILNGYETNCSMTWPKFHSLKVEYKAISLPGFLPTDLGRFPLPSTDCRVRTPRAVAALVILCLAPPAVSYLKQIEC